MGKRVKFNCIYVLIAPNKSAYIGQTSDPINRKSRYKTLTCKNQIRVYQSLLRFGFDKHEFKILLVMPNSITRQSMDFYEIFFYELYKNSGYSMMNLKSPGWNGKPCEESKQKSSRSHLGKEPWNKGKKGLQTAWNKGLKK